jgi:hypothetical protein
MKDAYYFKHDANARHDPKIEALIEKYGMEGYGRFWVVIEMLRCSAGYKIEDKAYVWLSLAGQMACSVDNAREFIRDCAEKFELFVQEDGFFYSASLLERMIQLDEIRRKRGVAGSWDRNA